MIWTRWQSRNAEYSKDAERARWLPIRGRELLLSHGWAGERVHLRLIVCIAPAAHKIG